MAVMELASIKLAKGKTEAELLAASARLETDFLAERPGYLRRDMVRRKDGTYLDIILWESQALAEAAVAAAQDSPAAGAYFTLMDFEAMDEGMEHTTLLASHTKS